MKKKQKKILIGILSGCLICLIIIACVILNKDQKLVYKIDNEIKEELSLTMEYGETLDLSPQALHLTAQKDEEQLDIVYEIPEINELKTYTIEYHVMNEEMVFLVHLKVTDTTNPVITGEMNYQVYQGESFDLSSIHLTATDNFNQDLTNKLEMDEVDTSEVGVQNIQVWVKDSNNNEAKVTIQLEVKKKNTSTGKIIVSNPNDVGVLVNKTHFLPDGWAPFDLVPINSNTTTTHYLRSEAADQWESLRIAALNDGITINVVSSYRTQSYQTNLYNKYMATDPENAPYYSAYPRTSEHELGLGIDISYDWSLHDDLQNSAVGSWMNTNGWQYGWILRYPQGKTDITGYIFEAWHYRYVGVDLATKLHQTGLTLDEYYY